MSRFAIPSINEIEFELRNDNLISNNLLDSVMRVEDEWRSNIINYQSIAELNSTDLFLRLQNWPLMIHILRISNNFNYIEELNQKIHSSSLSSLNEERSSSSSGSLHPPNIYSYCFFCLFLSGMESLYSEKGIRGSTKVS